MKRLTRRTVGAIVGLCLGWMAAGMALGPGNLSLAADAPRGEQTEHGHTKGHDKGMDAAAGLVPRDAQGHEAAPAWFSTVVKLIAGMFIAALVIGIPALKAKGGDPAGLASAHDQAHAHHDDAHGDAHQAHDTAHAAHAHH